jgi:flagellar protein FlaG
MSIQAITNVAQPAMVKGDGLHNLKGQEQSVISRPTSSHTELPSQSVKGVSSAEEEEKLSDAVDKANEFIMTMNQELNFSVDKDTGKTVVKVIDKQTGDVIRQIPSKEMLEIAKALDTINGLIIRKNI